MQRRSIAIGSLFLLAVCGLATAAAGCPKPEDGAGARAATPTSQPQVASTTPAPEAACTEPTAAAAGEAGMRAYLDPETGVIGGMPPVEEGGKAAVADPILNVETLPDGSLMVDLQGACQEYYVIELDANGQRVVRCVQDPKSITQTAPAVQPEDR